LKKISLYLRMIRPANVLTSIADVLAGVVIAGFFLSHLKDYEVVLLLCVATAGLYSGGIVFNDVFDADLDKAERPERAIPSGAVTLREAVILGAVLFFIGIVAALLVSTLTGIIAVLIAVAALFYNKFSKHHPFIGPLNMGLCRGLNLLLGISVSWVALYDYYFLAYVPMIYIFSITMISRGEVHGGDRKSLYLAGLLYLLVIAIILYFGFIQNAMLLTFMFIAPFAWMIFRPLLKAAADTVSRNIGQAVKAGVLSLIVMDAAWAAAFGSVYAALFIVCLLPVSLWLAARFAVT
jgi:4-hydroxybenzoate polyprenyltransferase